MLLRLFLVFISRFVCVLFFFNFVYLANKLLRRSVLFLGGKSKGKTLRTKFKLPVLSRTRIGAF